MAAALSEHLTPDGDALASWLAQVAGSPGLLASAAGRVEASPGGLTPKSTVGSVWA